MEDISKMALAVSIPVWASLAAMFAFTVYYAGLAGIGIMFIIVIVVTFYWYKVLEGFTIRASVKTGSNPTEHDSFRRLDAIEAKIDKLAEKVKE